MGHEDLGAIDEDVPFDWDGAAALITAFETMASEIETQRSQRTDAAEHAMVDWLGEAVTQYVQRHNQGDLDAGELVTALRDAAEDVRAMQRAAQEEQDRREAAREYVRALEENEENEGFFDKVGDFFGGEDFEPPPMPPPPTPEPNLTAPTGPVSDTRV